MLNTTDITEAFAKEASKVKPEAAPATGTTAMQAAATQTAVQQPAPNAEQQAAPAPAGEMAAGSAAPSADQMDSIRAFFRGQGIEMSPEEIATKVKELTKPQPAPAPAEPTVDEAEIETYFEKLNKKDKYAAFKAAKSKTDLDLVLDFKKPQLKEKFPNWSDEQLETYIKRSYFQDTDGFYEDDDKAYGQTALAHEAGAIRTMIDDALANATDTIKGGKMAAAQNQRFEAHVDQLLKDTSKLTFNLGVSGQKDLGVWDLPLHDETKTRVKTAISTPEAFAKYVSDPSGQLDLKKVMDMVIAYEMQPILAKSIATEYHSRGVSQVEAVLGDGIKLNGHAAAGEKNVDEENARQASKVVGTRFR